MTDLHIHRQIIDALNEPTDLPPDRQFISGVTIFKGHSDRPDWVNFVDKLPAGVETLAAAERVAGGVVSAIVDMWPELPPRPVNQAEGELLNALLLSMLSRLREKGIEVPDVRIIQAKDWP